MQTRRDQVQAHQFVVSRLTTGLLRADPDAPETPNRRTNHGVAVGAIIAVLVCIGFLVYGFIRPGGASSWRDGDSMLVEKGTGTRYLYDGRLRSVRNYASARLIVGANMTTESVAAASLAGTPHGNPVGIEGAPDAFPAAADLDSGPWEVCAGTRATESGGRASTTSLVVDSDQPVTGIQEDKGVFVRNGKATFLLWHGNRFKLAGGGAADALGYSASEPLAVSAAFLDALPAGADLAAPAVAGQGGKGPELDGRQSRIGQVFTVRTPGSAQQYYLLQKAGLVPVTVTQAALALGGPGVREKAYAGGAPVALPLSADALGGAVASGGGTGEAHVLREAGAALPASPPALVGVADGASVCARVSSNGDQGTGVSLGLADSAIITARSAAAPGALEQACLAVDTVAVPPSGGSLVRALSSTGGAVGDTTYLVTDTGVKYRIPTEAAAQALGYDLAEAQALPLPLLTMLPTGPDLSPEAALAGRSEAGGSPRCGK